jgi:dTDP-4-dehydrorhamnose 3,5-epimerase
MIFSQTTIAGVWVIQIEKHQDDRGFFARTWCEKEAAAHHLIPEFAQHSLSFNKQRGTLRGMHFQADPHSETKVVRCTRGSVWDVVLDLRRDSATFGKWLGFDLSAGNRTSLYIPEGVAHGFQTLEPDTELLYLISPSYVAESARGVRWNDPAFTITWPVENPIMSERDRSYGDFGR